MAGSDRIAALALSVALPGLLVGMMAGPVWAKGMSAGASNPIHAGQLDVPLNKSQVVQVDQPFSRAMIGNPDIADIMPITNRSLYVLGKKMGTTSLTVYDSKGRMVSVVDVAVGPDIVSLRRQMAELMPREAIGARISNDSVVLTGTVSSGAVADKALQLAKSYAGDKLVNMMSIGASQQVMLEVRFSEINRQAAKDLGFNHSFLSNNGKTIGSIGNTASASALATSGTMTAVAPAIATPHPVIALNQLQDRFGIIGQSYSIGGLNIFSTLDALERKGLVKTLAEPTLVALSGETASFLAGGEFPIPVIQGNSTGTGATGGTGGITVEFKPFGVGLSFTPTILADGVINIAVQPEVSSIDPSASITINGLVVPGLQTRRANTVVELRDGEAFALAGLIRRDFQTTVRQIPLLGSIPVLGALFRSSGFQKGETELVIVVTPRIVNPVRPDQIRLPTDRVGDPSETDLFLRGRTDKAVGTNLLDPNAPPPEQSAPSAAPSPAAPQSSPSKTGAGYEY